MGIGVSVFLLAAGSRRRGLDSDGRWRDRTGRHAHCLGWSAPRCRRQFAGRVPHRGTASGGRTAGCPVTRGRPTGPARPHRSGGAARARVFACQAGWPGEPGGCASRGPHRFGPRFGHAETGAPLPELRHWPAPCRARNWPHCRGLDPPALSFHFVPEFAEITAIPAAIPRLHEGSFRRPSQGYSVLQLADQSACILRGSYGT
jgi:hypothetical protein